MSWGCFIWSMMTLIDHDVTEDKFVLIEIIMVQVLSMMRLYTI